MKSNKKKQPMCDRQLLNKLLATNFRGRSAKNVRLTYARNEGNFGSNEFTVKKYLPHSALSAASAAKLP